MGYFNKYGYSSTGKLHKCSESKVMKCGLGRVYGLVFNGKPDTRQSNHCKRCFGTPKIQSTKPRLKDLIDKTTTDWCGRIGIRL